MLTNRSVAAIVSVAVALSGCAHIGPRTIVSDRFDYSTAIATSWKEQTLLNIVKLRNADLAVFVDVSSIVSGYSLETSLSGGGTFSGTDTLSLGGEARFTDRPTITYTPMTGEKFLRGLINPIDPKNIFFMVQAGYPADFLLGMSVESINGVRNRSATGLDMRPADVEFVRALTLLRELQVAGAVGMRIEEQRNQPGQTAALFFRSKDLTEDVVQKSAEIRRLLKLSPDEDRFVLVYSPIRGAPNEIAVKSRSILQIMTALSSYVEGRGDVRDNDAQASAGNPDDNRENIHIRSGTSAPDDVYARVRYKGRWYWVDDDDFSTKRALSTVILLFTLADTGGNDKLPLITIPAQ